MNNDNLIARNFVAVDVEWATRDQMICQIGLVEVRNGEIKEHHQWLVQPPGNEYDETLFRNHHIRPEMTATAPTLYDLWPEIHTYFLMGQIWAHNAASAEMPAFRKSLGEYGIPCDWLDIRDSKELFQRDGCSGGNGLAQCAMAMDIAFDDTEHHDALYDAEILAEMLIRYAEGYRPRWDDVPESTEQMRKAKQEKRVLHLGEFCDFYNSDSSIGTDVYTEMTSTCPGAQPQMIDVFDKGDKFAEGQALPLDFTRLDATEGNPLRGKKVCITGLFRMQRKDIEKALDAMGAKRVPKPARNTDAVILGTRNVGFTKLCAIEEQQAKGHVMAIIVGDDDLEALLYGDGKKFF
jgi:DNA polymerase-3 subunit epsilon